MQSIVPNSQLHNQGLPAGHAPHSNVPALHQSPQVIYEGDEGLTSMRAVSLLAVGSAVGLTAAAAFRWLNGGDFDIFPSAEISAEVEERRLEAARTIQSQQKEREALAESQNERLSSHFKSLVDSLQSHTQQNERIVQRLSGLKNSRLTDDSVDLLRNQERNVISSTAIFLKLAEIQAELSCIKRDMVTFNVVEKIEARAMESWEERLSTMMAALTTCLEDLQPANSTLKVPARGTESTATPTPSYKATKDVSLFSRPENSEKLDLAEAIENLLRNNQMKDVRKGAQVLYLFAINLASQPNAPRYRKIFTSNSSYQTISSVVGSKDILQAVGFVASDDGKSLEWVPANSDLSEDHCSVELKKAAVGLGVLKSPASRPIDELSQVVRSAMAAEEQRLRPDKQTATTPIRSNSSSPDLTPVVPSTPDVGSIVSPPVTRKQPFIPATDLVNLIKPTRQDQSGGNTSHMFQSALQDIESTGTPSKDVSSTSDPETSTPSATLSEERVSLAVSRDISSIGSEESSDEEMRPRQRSVPTPTK